MENKIEQVEEFVNEVLKDDLKSLEFFINTINDEILDYSQLKTTLKSLFDSDEQEDFKTQMNIGGNVFMTAKAKTNEKILVEIGVGYYLDFTPDEADKFIDFKLKILHKQCELFREEVLKKAAEIKLCTLHMAEAQKLN